MYLEEEEVYAKRIKFNTDETTNKEILELENEAIDFESSDDEEFESINDRSVSSSVVVAWTNCVCPCFSK